MAKTLMEQIEDEEKQLSAQGEDDGNKPIEPAPKAESDAEPSESKPDAKPRGRAKRAEPPQGESEPSPEDGEAPPRDSGGTRKDGGTPPEGTDGGVKPKAEGEDAPESPAAWARMRRELREAKAKLRDKEASLVPAAKPEQPTKLDDARQVPKVADDPEPDRNADPEAWKDWRIREQDRRIAAQEAKTAAMEAKATESDRQQEVNKAVKEGLDEFMAVESRYIKENPDYVKAAEFGRQKYTEALKVMNPQLSDPQISQHIDFEIIKQASKWAEQGLNPAEEFYDYCIERLGYKPGAAKVETNPEPDDSEDGLEALANQHRGLPAAEPVKERAKPSLKQINGTKRRSASPLHGPGQGGSTQVTKEAAAEMTMAEFSELTPQQLAELEAMEA